MSLGVGGQSLFLFGGVFLAIGGSLLALLSLWTEIQLAVNVETGSNARLFVTVTSAGVFLVGVAVATGVLFSGVTTPERVVVLALALQALFLTVDVSPSDASRRARVVLLGGSHGVMLVGSIAILWIGALSRGAILLYVVGIAFLSLHAFWGRQRRSEVSPPRPESRRRYWESLLLLAIVSSGVGSVAIVFTLPSGTIIPYSLGGRILGVVVGIAAVVELAMLSVPPSPPRVLAAFTGPRATIAQHVVGLLVITNTSVLGMFLLVPESFVWMLTALVVVLFVATTINYLSLCYGLVTQTTPDASPRRPADGALTVVVSAANEADVLSETLRHNLAVLPEATFLLVPAAHSTDDTGSLMKSVAADHADRVQVIVGDAGSKAGDLNKVWPAIETPYVLLLDADETVSPGAIRTAHRQLRKDPMVGIVQGRKLAAYPDDSLLSRFVTSERQHSTWIDHPFFDEVLNTGHFAGSAAVLRREVVANVDGFSPDALTEDIDLTVRVYLTTDWKVVYEPELVVRQLSPRTWQSLVRQRERWARGWAQVAAQYLGGVVAAGRRIGGQRAAGLSWELGTAISSPVYTLSPALIIYLLLGPTDPSLIVGSTVITVYLLVERGVSFGVAVLFDPELPAADRWSVLVAIGHGYVWILFGWVIQLHSLYLQLAGASESWDVTDKRVPDIISTSKRARKIIDDR